MKKLKQNEKGFSAVELILVFVVIVLMGVVGWMVYKNHHKQAVKVITVTKTVVAPYKSISTTVNPYSGWKTYNLATLGISFQYPSSWVVSEGQPECTGAIQVTATPGGTEVSQAASTTGANLKSYIILIDKYGIESSSCAPDGNALKGVKYNYLQSSDMVASGALKSNWLTFFGSTSGEDQTVRAPASGTLPDTGVLTDTEYTPESTTFTDEGTVSFNGSTYQIEIITSSITGQQYISPVPMNISLLKTTSLYKDSINILNSFN